MATAMIVGSLCYGPLDRLFDTRKRIVVGAALANVAVLGVLALTPGPALWQAVPLLALLGFAGPYAVVVMAHGRSIFPERLVGGAITVINTAKFAGVAVMQMATGLIIGAFPATDGAAREAAYCLVFARLAATVLLALAFYGRAADVRPSQGLPTGHDAA